MNNYFIQSERLGFSKWSEEKFPFAQKLWGNLSVTKLIDSRGQLSKAQILEKLKYEINNQEKFGLQYFPIFLLENDQFIGCCGLKPYDIKNGIYEVGFHILPNHWRRGFGKEAAERIIKFAFNQLNIKELFAGHHPNNKGSEKLLEKLGFKYIGDQFYEPTGLNHPSYKIRCKIN
ncbi:GNAT family N-acetyltransferase [Flexithrix dorotheae]|uniref:GNAT family N-acetyltransferase n=1 Tax=Flexithrix dorotheae TaxID=70993 RepID=UPI00035FD653|nr:GNAT family N-acetyltransferase [Flexithrix dorotheae]